MKRVLFLSITILLFSCNTGTKTPVEVKSKSIDSVGFAVDSSKSTMTIYSDDGNAVYNLKTAQPLMAIGVTSSQVKALIAPLQTTINTQADQIKSLTSRHVNDSAANKKAFDSLRAIQAQLLVTSGTQTKTNIAVDRRISIVEGGNSQDSLYRLQSAGRIVNIQGQVNSVNDALVKSVSDQGKVNSAMQGKVDSTSTMLNRHFSVTDKVASLNLSVVAREIKPYLDSIK